jgi:hypothetical protein
MKSPPSTICFSSAAAEVPPAAAFPEELPDDFAPQPAISEAVITVPRTNARNLFFITFLPFCLPFRQNNSRLCHIYPSQKMLRNEQ